jgi:hypothetical protein
VQRAGGAHISIIRRNHKKIGRATLAGYVISVCFSKWPCDISPSRPSQQKFYRDFSERFRNAFSTTAAAGRNGICAGIFRTGITKRFASRKT